VCRRSLGGGFAQTRGHPLVGLERGPLVVEFRIVGRRLVGMTAPPTRLRLFLELGRVAQHDLGKVDRPVGGEDRSGVARLDEGRQAAAVIEVRVGEQHGVQRRWLDRERHPVAAHLVR